MSHLSMTSPAGDLTLFENDGQLVAVDWGWVEHGVETALLTMARRQLGEYFDGRRRDFSLPLSLDGTPFQQKVWAALSAIPYGTVLTYGALASIVGSAPRAVGGACGRNPVPIIVPCHRVLPTDGGLGGYSGLDGPETKRFLLALEGVLVPETLAL